MVNGPCRQVAPTAAAWRPAKASMPPGPSLKGEGASVLGYTLSLSPVLPITWPMAFIEGGS